MIIKFINNSNRTRESLKKKIQYVNDSNKTDDSLVGSICCSKKYPYYDMVSTKMLHHKETGKQYEHYVVGFDPNDDIDYKRALRIVNDIALHFKYNQSFFAIHNNTEHLHAHVIMNTVDCFGKRFRQWKPQLNDFKAHVNQICQRNKIAPIKRYTDEKTFGKRGELRDHRRRDKENIWRKSHEEYER